MEKINLGSSIKNIPIPTQKGYLLQLMHEDDDLKTEWYGLKSLSSPRPVKELTPFEND